MENKINSGEDWWANAGQLKESKRYSRLYRDLKFDIKDPVLEIGGGAGTFLKFVGVKNATIIDLVGKESLVGNYNFIRRDITRPLELGKKYKTIFLMEVLEHIKNPLYLMAQVYDLLEDDGVCYIAVPYTKLDIQRKNQENKLNCHVSRWKLSELINQMKKIGFNGKVVQKRRRFKNTAFFLPHCWIVLRLTKRLTH